MLCDNEKMDNGREAIDVRAVRESLGKFKFSELFIDKLVEKSALLTCIGKEFSQLADEVGISRGGAKDQMKQWQ